MAKSFVSFLLEKKFENNVWLTLALTYRRVTYLYLRLISPHNRIRKQFINVFGRVPNLENPQLMNEKIQWLKLYDHKEYYTTCADKYEVRNWLKSKFSNEFLIPLIYQSENYRDINPSNITRYPCIVKANHSSKDYEILRSPDSVDWARLKRKCKWWLQRDYYMESLEWQYKKIKRKIVVEELLQTKEGKIPNDYKLHYINGSLKFVYVSVDREGENCRNIYDSEWKPLYFDWSGTNKNAKSRRGTEVSAPLSFSKMKELGGIIAKEFPYVRVDFYDVDGKLYFGEITLHHGGGFDVFIPEKYDKYYGDMLFLASNDTSKQ